MKKILILTISLLSFACVNAQKYNLALNLSKNKTYTHKTTSSITIDETIDGKPFNIIMSISGNMTYKVTDIKDSVYLMEVKYKSLKYSMTILDQFTEYSSEKKDETDIMSTVLAKMVDKAFYLKMTKAGKIREVKNLETLFSEIFSEFPSLTQSQKEQLMDQLMQSYGEKSFKGSIEMLTAIFPDKSVSVNDKWTINTKLESGFAADILTEYHLLEATSSYYSISGSSEFTTADKDAYIQSNGKNMKYDLTGTQRSDIKIDRKSGWIIEAKTTQNISGTTYIKADTDDTEDMVIPIKMRSEIVLTK